MAKVNILTNIFTESTGWVLPEKFGHQIAAADSRVRLTVAQGRGGFQKFLPQAEVIFGRPPVGDDLKEAARLKWVQLASAGADTILTTEFAETDIVVTTAAGASRIQISEHVFAMMLMFARRMHEYQAAQAAGRWDRSATERVGELYEKTLGIVGLGNIGQEVARKAKAFAMRVVATKRVIDKAAVPDVDELLPVDQLDDLLKQSDYLLLAMPRTPQTTGLIGARELSLMKPTAVLINVGRGQVVDQEALSIALHDGAIAGAALDTFVTEPLPAEDPMWRMPNVIITPHTAGATPRYWERATALFCENLARYLENKPLRNVVSRERGY
ncbi:MAG: D-2-hydroxyacid dehydrogenase [Anaerolineaceae bacterium]|nr:D-2-hydroxyacid dehydrogenase [Anaerolineaceae bacterium]